MECFLPLTVTNVRLALVRRQLSAPWTIRMWLIVVLSLWVGQLQLKPSQVTIKFSLAFYCMCRDSMLLALVWEGLILKDKTEVPCSWTLEWFQQWSTQLCSQILHVQTAQVLAKGLMGPDFLLCVRGHNAFVARWSRCLYGLHRLLLSNDRYLHFWLRISNFLCFVIHCKALYSKSTLKGGTWKGGVDATSISCHCVAKHSKDTLLAFVSRRACLSAIGEHSSWSFVCSDAQPRWKCRALACFRHQLTCSFTSCMAMHSFINASHTIVLQGSDIASSNAWK